MRIVEAWTHFANDEPEKGKKKCLKAKQVGRNERRRSRNHKCRNEERGGRYDGGRMETTEETEVSAGCIKGHGRKTWRN